MAVSRNLEAKSDYKGMKYPLVWKRSMPDIRMRLTSSEKKKVNVRICTL
jgi:hypothetical protein